MKKINIKTYSGLWDQLDNLKDNIYCLEDGATVVKTVGSFDYIATVFEVAGTYKAILGVPLFNSQFIGNDAYLAWNKATLAEQAIYVTDKFFNPDITYADNGGPARDDSPVNSKWANAKLDLTNSLKTFILNDDDTFEYEWILGFSDQDELALIDKFWQNNTQQNGKELVDATYKKGNQITAWDQYSIYRTLFESAVGVEFANNNTWPGKNSVLFYDYTIIENANLLDLLAAIIQIKDEINAKQCAAFKDRFYDQNGADAIKLELAAAVKDLEEAIAAQENIVAEATEAVDTAEQNLEDVQTEAATSIKIANETYNTAVETCANEFPVGTIEYEECVANAAVARDAAIAAANADIATAQEQLDQAQATLDSAEATLSTLQEQDAAAEQALEAQEQIMDQIAALCGGPAAEKALRGAILS